MNIFDRNKVKSKTKYTHHHILDLSQLVVATIVMEMQKETPNFDENFMRHLILNTIRKNIFERKNVYPEIIIATDGRHNWRKKIAYYYKQSRKESREKTNFNWDIIYNNLNMIIPEIKENFPYKVITIDNAEADDIIAVLTKYFSQKGEYTLITSGDGDFVQLQQYDNVKQWSPTKKKWIISDDPKFDLLKKIVKGDTSDTISNIKSPSDYLLIKEKNKNLSHSERLIKFIDKTPDNTMKRAPSITQVFLEALYKSEDLYSLLTDDEKTRFNENKKLVDFEEIPLDIREKIILQYEELEVAPRKNIFLYLAKHDMKRLINSVNEF